MQNYVKNMIDAFLMKIEKSQAVKIPANKYLFKVDGIKPLKKNKA